MSFSIKCPGTWDEYQNGYDGHAQSLPSLVCMQAIYQSRIAVWLFKLSSYVRDVRA